MLATPERTEFQLDCPKRFIVGGLDAELSIRAIEIGFVGGLGSPVNPGITTTGSAVFLRYSLAQFLRLWLVRLIHEQRQQ